MATLITLDQVKLQLRIVADDTSHDDDLTQLMDAAEAIDLDYIATSQAGRDAIATWTDSLTVPKQVQQAILYHVAWLDRYRGDDPTTTEELDPDTGLPRVVVALLRRVTDPVFA
jgi:hypothetical protein